MNKILSGYAEGNYYSADVDMSDRLRYLSPNKHYYYVLGQRDDLLATFRLPDGSVISHDMDDNAEAAFMVMEVDTDNVYNVMPLDVPMKQVRFNMSKHPDYYMGQLIDTYEDADENMMSESMEYRIIGSLYSDVPGANYAYDRIESIEYEHHVESFERNEYAAQKWLLENHAEHWFGASIIPVKEGSQSVNNPIPEYYESLYQTRDRKEILEKLAQGLGVETLGFSDGTKIPVEQPVEPYHTVTYMESSDSGVADASKTKNMELGGSYNIKDPDDCIAAELLHMMAGMRMETRDGEGHVIGVDTLKQIPEFWDIKQAVAAKEDICVYGDLIDPNLPEIGYSISFEYNGRNRSVVKSFSAGQFEYYGKFDVQEIERENVRFIPVENFQTPYNGVGVVQRFYTEPFVSESAARQNLDKMPLHDIPDVQTSRGMFVCDIDKVKDTDWYKTNMACVELVNASNGALTWDKDFDVWAQTHAARLTMDAPDNLFLPSTATIPVTNKNVLAVSHAMEDYVKYHEDRVANMSPSEDPQIEDAMIRSRDEAVKERDYYRDGILVGAKFDLAQIPIPGYKERGMEQTGPTSIRSQASTTINMPGFNMWLQQTGNLDAIRLGCYGLSKSDAKSYYYDKQDYYQGLVNSGDKLVQFKRMLNGRVMSDAECEQLCANKVVKLEGIPKKSGGTYTGYGVLLEKSFTANGRTIPYYGVDISFKQSDAEAKLHEKELKSFSEKKSAFAKESGGTKTAAKQDASFFSNKYGTKYCVGKWNGKEIKFKPMYKNEAVSESDCKKFLAGESVMLTRKDTLGNEYQSSCQLANMTYKNRTTGKTVSYIGIKETGRFDMDGKPIAMPSRGHEFDGVGQSSGTQADGPVFG